MNTKMNIKYVILLMSITLILGVTAMTLNLYKNAQATICPIDQVSEHLQEANTAYNEQNYVELKNSLDSIQELIDSVKEEE